MHLSILYGAFSPAYKFSWLLNMSSSSTRLPQLALRYMMPTHAVAEDSSASGSGSRPEQMFDTSRDSVGGRGRARERGPGANIGQRQLRPLAPSPGAPINPAVLHNTNVHIPPRRRLVAAACEACRRHKRKVGSASPVVSALPCAFADTTSMYQCDAVRPRCHACQIRDNDCVYTTDPEETRAVALKRKVGELETQLTRTQSSNDSFAELLGAIRNCSEADAAVIFQRVRQGTDLDTILQHISTVDLLLERQLQSESRFRHDYLCEPPIPLYLQEPQIPYSEPALYGTTHQPIATGSQLVHSEPISAFERQSRPPYPEPFPAATVVDHRLNRIQPSNWTDVSSDDDFMRKLIQLYFFNEYAFWPCFHKDHFLDDMLSDSTLYCSSLLVNIVLARAVASLPSSLNIMDQLTELS